MTDEDLVELSIFDGVLAQIQHKHSRKMQALFDFLKYSREEAHRKLSQLQVKAQKQKDQVIDACFANSLNHMMEQQHSAVASCLFKHSLLY